MSWKTMLALLLVVGVLLLLHSLMHIDPNQPPPKVILSLEVALISLLLIDVIWGHLVHFLQVLTNQAHGAEHAINLCDYVGLCCFGTLIFARVRPIGTYSSDSRLEWCAFIYILRMNTVRDIRFTNDNVLYHAQTK